MEFCDYEKLMSLTFENWKLIALLTAFLAIYFRATSNYNFFEKKVISYMKPTIFVGNLWCRITRKKSFSEYILDICNYFKGKPYGGVFEGVNPILYVFDPDLIKAITIRDFEHFVDRRTLNSNEPPYLKRSLINLKGSEWKVVRSAITPSFSSARLKNMLPLVQQCSNQMVELLKQRDKCDVEMKDFVGHFTLEVIGTCAFGIKTDSLTDENAYFVQTARQFDNVSISRRILFVFLVLFVPEILKYVNVSMLNPEVAKELVNILQVTKAERKSAKIKKNDFLQLLIEAAHKEKQDAEQTGSHLHLDEDTIDAQSFLFLIAGYETSSTLLSFGIHTLALKPELQEKLREHIEEVTYGKEITYELLNQLTYLEAFLLETLRMYPPFSRVERVCTKKYTLPRTSVNISVGDIIAIPVYGVHMNPDIYPEPMEFKPERFMGDEKKNRPSHLFLAFGAGPRNCIGLRFAMISAKLAMVSLLKNFKFSICSKTENPVTMDKAAVLLKASTGLWVNIEKI